MKLYIDLDKAVNPPNAGVTVPSAKRAARQYKESFNRRPVGVLGGGSKPSKTPSKQGTPLDDELEEERQADDEEAKKRGLVPEKSIKKAFGEEACDLLKSVTSSVSRSLDKHKPNPREKQFLMEVKGYKEEDINKGLARISGSVRSEFDEWLCSRLSSSVNSLLRK